VGGAWSAEQIQTAFEKIGFTNINILSKDVSDEYAKKWGHGLEIKTYIQSSLIYAEKSTPTVQEEPEYHIPPHT
jgi:methyltransferase type 11